jgi:hypothetical protein
MKLQINQLNADRKNAIRPGFKAAWYVVVFALAAFQISEFLRLKRQGENFFSSTREMILVLTLVAVVFVGIIVKSRRASRS